MTWKQQLADSVTTPEQLAQRFDCDPEPLRAVVARYPLCITPHTLKLIESPGDPIWMECVPNPAELVIDSLPEDSMNEAAFSPTQSVVHRYPERALLMVSGRCAGYCRFCTRKSRVGTRGFVFSEEQINAGLDYIAETPAIKDVILTGGDPLLLDDDSLEKVLSRLHSMEHVEIIRIGSRVPVTLPDRITPGLCQVLAKYHPLYVNTHFNHPRELTPESLAACALLANCGVSLGNQTVLLRRINDDPVTMLELCRGLLKARVKPYYLHHLDQAKGTSHFRVRIERGLEIIKTMRGQISGMGIPQYVVDPPGGEGKVPLLAENLECLGATIRAKTACGWVELPNHEEN